MENTLLPVESPLTPALVQGVVEALTGYKELMMMYSCAIREIRTKFEVLDAEFNTRYSRNPISSITSRLKSSSSIAEKILRKGGRFSLTGLEEDIHDIAGIRVICAYRDDIYLLADALVSQDDVTEIRRKDYIKNPKPNGYRSLHLIVSVPVFFAEGKRHMKVEVQIRTIAMDCWASLEHQMKYKKSIPNPEDISARLLACAETLAKTDEDMLAIRRELEACGEPLSSEERILEKLRALDKPLR